MASWPVVSLINPVTVWGTDSSVCLALFFIEPQAHPRSGLLGNCIVTAEGCPIMVGARQCGYDSSLFRFRLVKTLGNGWTEKCHAPLDFPNRVAHTVSAGLFDQIASQGF